MATQQTMVNWAKDQIYKWIDMDGAYGAQCVDLISLCQKLRKLSCIRQRY